MINSLKNTPEYLSSFLLLLALLLFLIAPIPITLFPEHYRLIFAIVYSLLILLGIWSLSDKRRHFIIGMVLGITSFIMIWRNTFSTVDEFSESLKTFSLFLFFSYLGYLLFQKIAVQKEITLSIIFGSISGYLLIGLIGGTLFQLLELSIPNSFNLSESNNGLFDLHYLSFVTLTTLGFGDITPINEAAKSLTLVIAIAGQLYLTILIAILVGKYLK